MRRRDFLKAIGLGAAAIAFPACNNTATKRRTCHPRPANIIFIMADDMGYGDVGCYNPDSMIPTPNMDRLAAQGIRFTDAHSPSAVCSPTRYGVLTGRYAWRTWMKRSVLSGYSRPVISQNQMTVAELLAQHGYRSACIGKWHLGISWQSTDGYPITGGGDIPRLDFSKPITDGPNHHGFDYSFITAACSTMDSPYVFIENSKCTALPTDRIEHMDPALTGNSRPGPMVPGWSNKDVDPTYIRKTEQFISRHLRTHKDKPFFIYLPLSTPHTAWLPPDFAEGKTKTGARGDMVFLADWCVGKVMEMLDHYGLSDDTLLIVTSDNGPRIGKAGHKSAGPFRGYKSHIWEGGHRVPFIARWPGKVSANTTSNEMTCLTDLMATCADVIGAKMPRDAGEDSFSTLPLMLGRTPPAPRAPVVHHSSNGTFAVRDGKWKLILSSGSGGREKPAGKPFSKPYRLFDMAADPSETTDLAGKNPAIVRRLTKVLESMRQRGRSRPD